jgi:hypothetical protein
MADTKRRRRATLAFDVPESVNSAEGAGWVYRSDELPQTRRLRPTTRSPIAPAIVTIAPAASNHPTIRSARAPEARDPLGSLALLNPVPWLVVGWCLMALPLTMPFVVGATVVSRLSRR